MNNRANECRGKRKYETQANAIAASVALKKRTGGDKANAYFCTECGKFHMGRKGGRNNKGENMLKFLAKEALKQPPKVLEPVSISKLSWVAERVRLGQSGVFSELATITPDIARHLLEYNVDNRRVKKALVDQIASDIKNNLWQVNGEAIIVAKDGQLNDGQHRLNAVIEANKPVKTIIIFGVDRSSRLTVDMGAARSTGDFLGMNGVKHGPKAAAIATQHWLFRRGVYSHTTTGTGATKQLLLNEHQRYAKEIDAGAALIDNNKFLRSHGGTAIGVAHILCHRANSSMAEIFFHTLATGEGLKRGSPVLLLRNWLIESKQQKLRANHKLEVILRYWNAFVRGAQVNRRFAVRGEYPKVEG